jgi:hypothetical protein
MIICGRIEGVFEALYSSIATCFLVADKGSIKPQF